MREHNICLQCCHEKGVNQASVKISDLPGDKPAGPSEAQLSFEFLMNKNSC